VVKAGTYTLTETTDSNYDASAWVCPGFTVGGAGSGTNTLALALGQSATCTVTNNDKAAHLTLVKVVTNSFGGTKTASDFPLTATGPVTITGRYGVDAAIANATVSAGSYTLTEQTDSAYKASAWSCPGYTLTGASANVLTLGNGQSASCTISNTDDPGTWTVIKNVVGGPRAGQASSFSFNTTFPAGFPTPSGLPLVNGYVGPYAISQPETANHSGDPNWSRLDVTVPTWTGYVVKENDNGTLINANGHTSDGYKVTYNTACVGPTTILPNGDPNCIITNTFDPPHLTLVKVVTNNSGGTKTVSDFTLFATGSSTSTSGTTGQANVTNKALVAGAFTLSESTFSNYAASAWSCPNFTLTGNGGANGSANVLTLNWGDSATCTIANDDIPGTWTVIKNVQGGPRANQASTFSFDTTWNPAFPTPNNLTIGSNGFVGPYLISQPETANHAFSPSWSRLDVSVPAWTGYTVLEFDSGNLIQPNGHTSDGYKVSYVGCGVAPDSPVTITAGGDPNCVITNVYDPAHLTLVKLVTNNNGGNKSASDFQLFAAGPTNFNGFGTATSAVAKGQYTLSENQLTGYQAVGGWSCTGVTNSDPTHVTLDWGQSATCTILNDDIPGKLTIVKKTDPGNSDEAFPFSLNNNGTITTFFLTGDASGKGPYPNFKTITFDKTPPPLTVTEVTDGNGLVNGSQWRLTKLRCDGGSNSGAVPNLKNGTVVVNVGFGDDVTCTYWNTLPRMTGGGSIFTPSDWQGPTDPKTGQTLLVPANSRVTHGFELYCGVDGIKKANNLEINWASNGAKSQNAWHLDKLNAASIICDGPSTLSTPGPEMPNAPFNHYKANGTGSLNNGKPNSYYAEWELWDWGEPGSSDQFKLTIWQLAPDGVTKITPAIISFGPQNLDQGNQQAH